MIAPELLVLIVILIFVGLMAYPALADLWRRSKQYQDYQDGTDPLDPRD